MQAKARLGRRPDGKTGCPVRSGVSRRARRGGPSERRARKWREKVGQRVHGQQLRSTRPARSAAGRSGRSALSGSPRAEQREAPHGVRIPSEEFPQGNSLRGIPSGEK